MRTKLVGMPVSAWKASTIATQKGSSGVHSTRSSPLGAALGAADWALVAAVRLTTRSPLIRSEPSARVVDMCMSSSAVGVVRAPVPAGTLARCCRHETLRRTGWGRHPSPTGRCRSPTATPQRRPSDAPATPQRRPSDAPATPQRRPSDAPATPQRRPSDAPATPQRRPSDAPATPQRRPSDAPATPQRRPISKSVSDPTG